MADNHPKNYIAKKVSAFEECNSSAQADSPISKFYQKGGLPPCARTSLLATHRAGEIPRNAPFLREKRHCSWNNFPADFSHVSPEFAVSVQNRRHVGLNLKRFVVPH